MACNGTDICPIAVIKEDLGFVLPYFTKVMVDEKIDPVKFALDNFQDESVGESIAKEIEKVKRK